MRTIPYLDLRQHWQDWHRYVLPLFVVIAALIMILVIVFRIGKKAESEVDIDLPLARIGLINPGEDAVFDPAFSVASPTELVRAPVASTFSYPVGSQHGALTYNAQPFMTDRHLGDDLNGIGGWNSDLGDPVYAVADGEVTFAGWPSDGWGNVVILLHELPDGQMIETFYGHLDRIAVPVGQQMRRGELIGTIGTANQRYLAHLHFELRRYPTIDVGAGYFDSKLGRLSGEFSLKKWRGRPDDRLSSPPAGTDLPPPPFQLDVADGSAPAP